MARLPDGTALFVPGALPGEHVKVRPTKPRAGGWAAVVDHIGLASPDRAMPPCPHFSVCGGCTSQHMADAGYSAWKRSLLVEALSRAGFADAAVGALGRSPASSRRRMDFALRREQGRVVLGLHGARSATVVDVQTCVVLHPDLVALLTPLRSVCARLDAFGAEGSVAANLLDDGPDVLLRTDRAMSAGDRSRLAVFAAEHGVARVSWARGRDAPETAAMLRPPVAQFAGVPVVPPPGAFLQATRQGEAAIVTAVLAGLPARVRRVADLYAGIGTLTLPLSQRASVTAFESDPEAAAALRQAVNTGGQSGRVTVQIRDLNRQPLSAAEAARFDAVVLDPPQAGAAVQMAMLAGAVVERVIYVSCNPQSLARDAAVLRGAGWQLLAATPIDQFLWSPRLESVSVFGRQT